MGASKIMTTNYLDPSLVSNSYFSSQQTAFPASNLYNAQRRSKVWRSNGNWRFLSTTNTLVFREQVGVDITATILAGDYTTAALVTALKAALDLVGAATYTVSYSTSTLKWTISSNLGGGATIFEIRWTSCVDMASTLGFDSASNDTGLSSYSGDNVVIHTEEWLKFDFGISTNPTAFCLIGERNRPIKITPSSTITLQGNETDVWTSPSYQQVITYDETVMGLFNDNGFHTEALRYWRVLISDRFNPLGYVEIGSLFLGIYFKPTRGAIQFGMQGNYVDRSNTVFSEGGQTFSDNRQKTEILNLEWAFLTKQEKEEIDDIFEQFGTSLPFFIQIDPNLALSTIASKYIRYVKFQDAPTYTINTANNFSCSMILREEL